jgi:hypothetical protein
MDVAMDSLMQRVVALHSQCIEKRYTPDLNLDTTLVAEGEAALDSPLHVRRFRPIPPPAQHPPW